MRGFSLIELMIAVVIIGVLVAAAVPQYQTYVSRSQVVRGMGEAAALKAIIENCLVEGRTTVAAGAGNCDPAATGSNILAGASQGAFVISDNEGAPQVFITAATGEVMITAQFGNLAYTMLEHSGADSIVLLRDADGSWRCQATIPVLYRPAGCMADFGG